MKNYLTGVFSFFGVSIFLAIVYFAILATVWKPKVYVKRKKNRRNKKKTRVNTENEAG